MEVVSCSGTDVEWEMMEYMEVYGRTEEVVRETAEVETYRSTVVVERVMVVAAIYKKMEVEEILM